MAPRGDGWPSQGKLPSVVSKPRVFHVSHVEGSPTARHPLLGPPRRELLEAPSGFPASLLPPQWLFLSMTSENKLETLQCHFILYSLPKSRQNGSELSQRCPHLHLRLPQLSFPYSWGVDPWQSTCLLSVKALGSISTTDRKHSHAPLIHCVLLLTDIPLHIQCDS